MNEIGEAELTSALRDGGMVDGAAEGGRRVARAGVLRKCLRGIQDQADPGGLRLENVFVAGRFDLTGLVIPFPLRFHGCEFGTAPVLEGAQLFELALRDSPHLPGLLANGLRVQRDLDLSGSSVTGVHWTSTSTSKRRRSGWGKPVSGAACCARAPPSTGRAPGRSTPTGSRWPGLSGSFRDSRRPGRSGCMRPGWRARLT